MRLRPPGTILVTVGVAAALALTAPAAADEPGKDGSYSEEDLAAARALFEAGSNLLAAGSYEDACRTFEASLQRVDGLGTRGKLAECYEKLGRIASAWRAYRQIARIARERGDDLRRRVAAKRLKVLEPRLPYLTIDTSKISITSELAIHDNGELVPDNRWNRKRPVDPGSHYIAVTRAGAFYWAHTVEISEGKQETITLPAPEGQDPAGPPIEPPDRGDDRDDSDGTTGSSSGSDDGDSGDKSGAGNGRRIAGLGIAGAGVAVLGVGAFFGLQARGKWNDAQANGCNSDGQCDMQSGVELVEQARSNSTRANVAFGAAAAALITGGVLWWTGRGASESKDGSPRVTISPTADGPGLVVHGTF